MRELTIHDISELNPEFEDLKPPGVAGRSYSYPSKKELIEKFIKEKEYKNDVIKECKRGIKELDDKLKLLKEVKEWGENEKKSGKSKGGVN